MTILYTRNCNVLCLTHSKSQDVRLVFVILFISLSQASLRLACGGMQGFLPEQYDQFAQDVVFKTFTPSVGVLLAGSAAYGLWKVGLLTEVDLHVSGSSSGIT